ncbi:hypothetical protein PGT21_031858 [Puccinia graminis f. sp. tritici]|uniref:Uncharacterized protein n=1 Tax=Puccinia graminis f. sp. tritici TaxID=56615 RepID=A0A5B0PD18_PUCGR|nr:hypothetical protein PGTUg99_009979 [Puccinia graminis f. sp. tritici]KAA1104791.1 hypothetical protein PGT21_031858 [Puccinia graminis f. sp. tritici]
MFKHHRAIFVQHSEKPSRTAEAEHNLYCISNPELIGMAKDTSLVMYSRPGIFRRDAPLSKAKSLMDIEGVKDILDAQTLTLWSRTRLVVYTQHMLAVATHINA